ncbi:MAG: carbohydrate ABC transporter permease [Oscillospiraceae bacterium]
MRRLHNKKQVDLFYISIVIILSFGGLIVLYPFYNAVLVSLVSQKEYIQTPFMLWPKNITLDAYLYLFEDGSIITGYRSTLMLVLIGVPYNLILTSSVAYAMSRPHFPGKKFFNAMIILTMYFGGGIIPTYLLIRNMGLLNSIASVILVYGVNTYNMIIMRNFFISIPSSIEESARIDGANDIVILCRIILPLSKPIVATMLLFFTVDRWNEWFNAMVFLRDNSKWPLQMVLRSIVNRPMMDFSVSTSALKDSVFADGIKMSAVVVTMLPVMLVYPFVQKHFMKGIMLGGVKA